MLVSTTKKEERENTTSLVEEFAKVFEEVCAVQIAIVINIEVHHEGRFSAEFDKTFKCNLLFLKGSGLVLHDANQYVVEEYLHLELQMRLQSCEKIEKHSQS